MKIILDIPKKLDNDYVNDRFMDFFGKVIMDSKNPETLSGTYEKEIAEGLMEAFHSARLYKNL